MSQTNEDVHMNQKEIGIWAFGLIVVVLGVIAILYYLRYVVVWSIVLIHSMINLHKTFDFPSWTGN